MSWQRLILSLPQKYRGGKATFSKRLSFHVESACLPGLMPIQVNKQNNCGLKYSLPCKGHLRIAHSVQGIWAFARSLHEPVCAFLGWGLGRAWELQNDKFAYPFWHIQSLCTPLNLQKVYFSNYVFKDLSQSNFCLHRTISLHKQNFISQPWP